MDEILTDINAKKQVGKSATHHQQEDSQSDSDGPSSPVRSRYDVEREAKSKTPTPTETDPGKRRRSLFRDSRNGRGTSLKGGCLEI